jgi:hypothetical protein
MNPRLFTFATVAVLLNVLPATAQEMIWPVLSACQNPNGSALPSRWQGVFLSAPFDNGQLVLNRTVYDSSQSAMSVSLYGVQTGEADFLVTPNTTYVLTYSGSTLTQCQSLGNTGWQPLPQTLVASPAMCVGSRPLAETAVDWWKMPAVPTSQIPLNRHAANWIWFKQADGSPFRFMFNQSVDSLAPLSWSSFSYQVRFSTPSQTDLSQIVNFCQSAAPYSGGTGRAALQAILDGMSQSPTRANAAINALMPELDNTCATASLPTWPQTFGMTTLMTSVNFGNNPWPTQLHYRWNAQNNTGNQRTRMLITPPPNEQLGEEALLLGAQGYDIYPNSCSADLPGVPRPNWPTNWPTSGGCSCAAVINGTTALTPYGSAQIMTCPMILPRVFWTWYTLQGRPMTFMETSSPAGEGTGLALADYYDWFPNLLFKDSVFDLPNQCTGSSLSRESPRPRAISHATPLNAEALPTACFNCHLGPSNPAR